MTDEPGQTPDPVPPQPYEPSSAPPPPPPPSAPAAPSAPQPAGQEPAPSDPFAAPAPGASAPPPPPQYGAPAGSGPAAPAYPQPGYPQPGYPQQYAPDPSLNLPFASWGLRVQSAFVDYIGVGILAAILYVISHPLGALVWLAALVWGIYNAVLGGQTGQSYGKKFAGTKLVSAANGQPIGGGMGFVRYLVHIVDGLPCYLGYLWPLWDAKRQTFSDKILGTYVVKV
jgi:uncharacterized RDD family membrane protein YckC